MEKKNDKWKVGFWIYFIISIILILYLFAKNNSNQVHLAFTKMDKTLIEQDLKMISEIINNTDLSRTEILNEIKKNKFYNIENSENNKIEFGRVILNFEKEKLVKLEIKESEIDILLR
ncbi:hypothetical protein [Flavobacterium sp.]|uniref:hypothetical protein n=1 Tax=Flavobacterium sp. TaxID=239 RepID=UPI002621CEC2|nr:hypothetical protein [Flavobacterium sp.]